ncbi:MAG: hypothetical protein J5741_03760 [Bacteroidales bacterium]|nr:hypothetical protein [Bacteroidales bacterium]
MAICLLPSQTRTLQSHFSCSSVTPSFIFNFQILIFNSSSYSFSAKEKDVETGLSYFGSRYYSSDLSIWLSVDPMAAKYASLSPYNYCANNPVKLVDPNGEEIGDYFNEKGHYLGTDGIDDGKIHIIQSNTWQLLKDNFSSVGNDGETYISSVLASDNPHFANIFSTKPSESNLSDKAIRNILEHYNSTGIILQIADKKALTTTSGKANGVDIILLYTNPNEWRTNPSLDNYYDIKSTFDHEQGHINQTKEIGHDRLEQLSNKEKEEYAISYQMKQPAFKRATTRYQRLVKALLESL